MTASPQTQGANLPTNVVIGMRLTTESVDVKGIMLSRKHWSRLKEEAEEAKMRWTEIWLGVSFAALGVGATALIAAFTVPSASGDERGATQISSTGHDILLVVGAAALLLAAACFLAWFGRRGEYNANLDQLVKNMKSHEHYEERGT